jgi:hypothetical protein
MLTLSMVCLSLSKAFIIILPNLNNITIIERNINNYEDYQKYVRKNRAD